MVRATGVLNMIMMSFISIPLVTVTWLLVGYTLGVLGTASAVSSATSHVGMAGIGPRTATALYRSCSSPPSS